MRVCITYNRTYSVLFMAYWLLLQTQQSKSPSGEWSRDSTHLLCQSRSLRIFVFYMIKGFSPSISEMVVGVQPKCSPSFKIFFLLFFLSFFLSWSYSLFLLPRFICYRQLITRRFARHPHPFPLYSRTTERKRVRSSAPANQLLFAPW